MLRIQIQWKMVFLQGIHIILYYYSEFFLQDIQFFQLEQLH